MVLLNREFLSRQEAIEHLGISKQCLHSLVTRGKITKIKKGPLSCFTVTKSKAENRISAS